MGMQEDIELAGLSKEEIEALKDEDVEIPSDDDEADEANEAYEADNAGETDDKGDPAAAEDETGQASDEKTGEADPDESKEVDENKDEDQNEGKPQESDSGKDEEGDKKPPDTGEKPEENRKPEKPSTPETSFNLKVEGKAEEINAQLNELKKKFDDGEIDFEEFLSARDDLKARLFKAEMYEDINKQVRQSAWESAKEAFVAQNPDIMNYASRAAGYAAILQDLLQSEDGQKMTDNEVLEKAREKFFEENPQLAPGLPGPEKDAKKDDPKSRVKELKSGQKKQQQVRTLANLPAAEANDTGSSEFAHLDNLPPEKLEKALEKMSDAEMERYLEA